MAEEHKPDGGAAPAVSAEALRKAEAYIEAEEGALNRLAGLAGSLVTGGGGGDVAVPPLCRGRRRLAVSRFPDHRHPAAALRACRFRADAELPAVPAVGALPQPHSLVGRRRGARRRRHPRLRHRGRRGVHRPRDHRRPGSTSCSASSSSSCCSRRRGAPPAGSFPSSRSLFIAYALLRPLSAAALDAPRLRHRAARRPPVHHARGHFRHSGRRVVDR